MVSPFADAARSGWRHRGPGELDGRLRAGTLRQLPGIGEATAQVVAQTAAGQDPEYLTRLLGGCARAELFGIGPDRVINARSAPVVP